MSDRKPLAPATDNGSEEVEVINSDDDRPARREGCLVTGTLLISIFAAVFGTGLLFGYNTGVLNNPSDNIKEFFNEAKEERTGERFSDNGLTWYWSCCIAVWALFAIVGCFLGSIMSGRVGRKNTMLLNNILLVIGTLLQSCSKAANSYEMFFLGRLVTGIHSGVCTTACPMYLSEIAPKSIRGGVGVTFQMSCVFGILLSQVLGFESILGSADLWPMLINLNLALGLVQCIILPFCPSSPRFLLISKNDTDGARRALARLRGESANIEDEMKDIIEEDRKEKAEPPVDYADLWGIAYLRRPLIIACVMMISQQFSGINAVNYYSAPIFKAALPASTVEKDPDFPNYMVAVTGAVNLVITTISIFTVDRLGRKLSHLIGLGGMAASALAIGFLISGLAIDDGQVCHGIAPTDATNYTTIVLIFVFVAFFSIGPGAIPWLIAPELFTSSPRTKALSIANTVNWLCNFCIALGFDPLRKVMCGWVFLIFFVLLVIFIIYLGIRLPNVEGKTVNEIVQMFKSTKDCEDVTPVVTMLSPRSESTA